MKLLFDLHTHTITSGHAFSTLKENIEEAARKGLLAMGTSDHSSAMEGAPTPKFFKNYRAIDREIMGVRIYTGVEVNIMDYDGLLDMPDSLLRTMDYAIASLHSACIESGNREENTRAIIGAMRNPFVKIIGHPDDDRYPIDLEKVVRAAALHNVALEINSASPSGKTGRIGAAKNIPRLLELGKKYSVHVIAGSDAHIWYDVGNLDAAKNFLEAAAYPEELVINTNLEYMAYILNKC
jgi:putative hydrolase